MTMTEAYNESKLKAIECTDKLIAEGDAERVWDKDVVRCLALAPAEVYNLCRARLAKAFRGKLSAQALDRAMSGSRVMMAKEAAEAESISIREAEEAKRAAAVEADLQWERFLLGLLSETKGEWFTAAQVVACMRESTDADPNPFTLPDGLGESKDLVTALDWSLRKRARGGSLGEYRLKIERHADHGAASQYRVTWREQPPTA